VADGQVTFRYKVGETGERRSCTLEVLAFLHRFLQHILPKGFVKVRYYGLFRVGARRALGRLRGRLWLQQGLAALGPPLCAPVEGRPREMHCPRCGQPLRLERVLRPHNRGPPSRATHGLRQQPSLR
jgi:hypothetical protein